jgi:hypothetical protein
MNRVRRSALKICRNEIHSSRRCISEHMGRGRGLTFGNLYCGLIRIISSPITVLRPRPYSGLGTAIGFPVDIIIGARRSSLVTRKGKPISPTTIFRSRPAFIRNTKVIIREKDGGNASATRQGHVSRSWLLVLTVARGHSEPEPNELSSNSHEHCGDCNSSHMFITTGDAPTGRERANSSIKHEGVILIVCDPR